MEHRFVRASRLSSSVPGTYTMSEEPKTRRKLRVLLIDGGGAKGVVPLEILSRLLNSADAYQPAFELFDTIVGTSIGGIIGVMLANLLHPEDLMGRIVELCGDVFGARHQGLTESFFGLCTTEGLYNHQILRNKLRETLSLNAAEVPIATSFEDLFTSAYVVTTELHRPDWIAELVGRPQGFSLLFYRVARIVGRPIVVVDIPVLADPPVVPDRQQEDVVVGSNILNDTALIDAMRCTSAAPTFFKSVWDGSNGSRYIDGGVGNNHPGEVAIDKIFSTIGQEQTAVVVSLGCGLTKDTTPFWNLADRIKSWWTDTEKINGRVRYFCERRGFQYFRFNPSFEEHEELKNLKLDCCNQVLLETAIAFTRNWCENEVADQLQAAKVALQAS